MTNTMISPTRYTLTEAQLPAALALAGITRTSASTLPPAAPAGDAPRALAGTPWVTNGTLDPGLRDALAVLADTRRVTTIQSNSAGRPTWVSSVIALGATAEPYVAHPADNDCDLVLLPTLLDAVLYADELVEITAGFSQDGAPPLTLALPALAALATLADALQRAKLQALLARTPEVLGGWTLADLEGLLVEGITHDDTRWAVAAVRHLAPVDLAAVRGHLRDGLAALQAAGIATSAGDQWSLSDSGLEVAIALGSLVTVSSVSTVALDATGEPSGAVVGILRTVGGVWLLTWNVRDDAADATLEQISATRALELLRLLLRPTDSAPPPSATPATGSRDHVSTPPPALPVCPQCGAATRPGSKFCTGCGHALG